MSVPNLGRWPAIRSASYAEHPRQPVPLAAQRAGDLGDLVARHDQVPRVAEVHRRLGDVRDVRLDLRSADREHRVVLARVGRLHPHHELHRLEELKQRGRLAWFHVNPGGAAVVDDRQVMLDVPVRAQDQALLGAACRQVVDLLGADAVQPAQAVLTADPEHVPVRPVDEAGAVGQGALLSERIAVVRGNAHVREIGRDGTGNGKQGTVHTARLCAGRRHASATAPSRTISRRVTLSCSARALSCVTTSSVPS